MKVAVIILTCNEEKNIADCIKTAGFADEIIVVDSGSTDCTQTIAREAGASVYEHAFDSFAGQRNYALQLTQAEWIFYLDADERMTKEAGQEIRLLVEKNEQRAYELKRMNVVLGQRMRYGAHRPDWSLRLYPRQSVHWDGVVHEYAEVTVPIGRMKAVMHHYTYQDWDSYFQKFNRYTTMSADILAERGRTAGFGEVCLHPAFAFFKAYVLKQGFRDGFLGFVMSVMAGFAVFVKYLKLKDIARRKHDKKQRI